MIVPEQGWEDILVIGNRQSVPKGWASSQHHFQNVRQKRSQWVLSISSSIYSTLYPFFWLVFLGLCSARCFCNCKAFVVEALYLSNEIHSKKLFSVCKGKQELTPLAIPSLDLSTRLSPLSIFNVVGGFSCPKIWKGLGVFWDIMSLFPAYFVY